MDGEDVVIPDEWDLTPDQEPDQEPDPILWNTDPEPGWLTGPQLAEKCGTSTLKLYAEFRVLGLLTYGEANGSKTNVPTEKYVEYVRNYKEIVRGKVFYPPYFHPVVADKYLKHELMQPLSWGGDWENDTSGENMDGSTELDKEALDKLNWDNHKEESIK